MRLNKKVDCSKDLRINLDRLIFICALIFLLCISYFSRMESSDVPDSYVHFASGGIYIKPINLHKADFLANPVIVDENPTLRVRAWRWSYNLDGIVSMNNYLNGENTAILIVHPWGIDGNDNIDTPRPNGVVFMGTREKNLIYHRHLRDVVNPFLNRMRGNVKLVAYSLPGIPDEIRECMYRSPVSVGLEFSIDRGRNQYDLLKKSKNLKGNYMEVIHSDHTIKDYFIHNRGMDDSVKYDGEFWDIPILLSNDLAYDRANDIVFYDQMGYEMVKDYLQNLGIKNILLLGYATDLCYKETTCGYQNLSEDFNVFLVGDGTLATFPAASNPAEATTAAIAKASVDHLIT